VEKLGAVERVLDASGLSDLETLRLLLGLLDKGYVAPRADGPPAPSGRLLC
jgi:hypothetical protein